MREFLLAAIILLVLAGGIATGPVVRRVPVAVLFAPAHVVVRRTS
jgi:hypothetical protein